MRRQWIRRGMIGTLLVLTLSLIVTLAWQFLPVRGLWLRVTKECVGCDLRTVQLVEADLRQAFLQNANLSGANLSEANLRGANLRGSVLVGSNLSLTNLSMANLQNANLSQADLSGASLINANLQDVNLAAARMMFTDIGGASLGKTGSPPASFSRTFSIKDAK